MRAIRVVSIKSGAADAEDTDRLRIELRRNDAGDGYHWYDSTSDAGIEGPKMLTVREALEVAKAWWGHAKWDMRRPNAAKG